MQSHHGDPELLMYVPFTCPVKVMSITVIGGGSGTSPNKIRLFKDASNLDLSNVVDRPST